MLLTRSHTCLVIRNERINIRGDGDLQSLWPASSENVLVNLLLLHCGHCLWDWTLPHGSRKQQTNDCTDWHNETILVVMSCIVFTATPGADICLKCAYVFTRRLQWIVIDRKRNLQQRQRILHKKKMSVHILQVSPHIKIGCTPVRRTWEDHLSSSILKSLAVAQSTSSEVLSDFQIWFTPGCQMHLD